ncbi:MAG: SAM-dependent methyltransferase [Nitrospirota bacterium]
MVKLAQKTQKADAGSIGHPELVAAIVAEIQATGPIPFVRFMELALYHPQFGYYMRATGDGEEQAGEHRIGWDGDYYTSSDVHPVFAKALARQARQIDELLGRPDPFTIVEMGAGKGLLVRDVLADCEAGGGPFLDRLRYVLVERSPAMREAQRRNLAPWLGRPDLVTWRSGLEGLDTDGVTGLFLSNELVDALPVHRIRIEGGEAKELFVDYRDGRFCERLAPLSTPALADYLDRLARAGITLPEGYTTEINLKAPAWMKDVARVLNRGVAITIDYGHAARDLYGPDRRRGTLLCYHRHSVAEDPYRRVGEQDLTAHVDFSALATAGEEAGLHVTGFTNQMSFLIGLGVEEMVGTLEPGSPEFQSVIRLLRPESMGRTFKILIQHKGLERLELDGLRFKPFFGDVLSQAKGERHEAIGKSVASNPSPIASSPRV